MSVGFLVTEEEGLDKRSVLKFELVFHLLHVEDGVVLVKLEVDGEFIEHFEALLSVVDPCLLHS